LVGIGAALLLIGANGRHILGFNIAGSGATLADDAKDAEVKAAVEADTAVTAAETPEGTPPIGDALTPGEGTATLLTVGDAELVRVDAAQVPSRVLIDLASSGIPVRSSADIDWGARRVDYGSSYSWYVKLRNGDVFKISYEDYGSTNPSVSRIRPTN
jgi:hypothetical protein